LTGCITTNEYQIVWPIPSHPKVIPIPFAKQENGYFITEKNAIDLVNNIDEMEAYEKKMELLVETMAKFYKAKLEDRKVEK
jgi:hypothetical protein